MVSGRGLTVGGGSASRSVVVGSVRGELETRTHGG